MPATKPDKTIELADLLRRRVRTVEVQIGDDTDETFWIKYRPDALTKQLQADLQASEDSERTAMLLVSFLVDWSLTVDGEPFAITAENVEALGLPLQMTISAVVWEDFNAHALGKAMSPASPPASNGS